MSTLQSLTSNLLSIALPCLHLSRLLHQGFLTGHRVGSLRHPEVLANSSLGQDAYSASGTDEAQVIDTATRKRTTRNAKRVLEQDTSAPPPKKSKTAASVNSLGKGNVIQ